MSLHQGHEELPTRETIGVRRDPIWLTRRNRWPRFGGLTLCAARHACPPLIPLRERSNQVCKEPRGARRLHHRQDHRRGHSLAGALGGRIELPQRLNLIAEEFQPKGPIGFWRINVNDPPAYRKESHRVGGLPWFIADASEVFDEIIQAQLVADFEFQRQGSVA